MLGVQHLGAIIGEISNLISDRDPKYDESGQLEPPLYVMANPKYGSEKKGAPTNYYLTVAPKKIKVNCELDHVDVVLCCDPKAFTHCNPLQGINPGGCLVWESSDTPEDAWQRIPVKHRQYIKDNDIKVYILDGFDVARNATDRTDLQLRMQGNSFLGALRANLLCDLADRLIRNRLLPARERPVSAFSRCPTFWVADRYTLPVRKVRTNGVSGAGCRLLTPMVAVCGVLLISVSSTGNQPPIS